MYVENSIKVYCNSSHKSSRKMFKKFNFIIVLGALSIYKCQSKSIECNYDLRAVVDTELDWWQNAVFYQIYPRSFMDSNGDGIGDLQGIINKLSHLKDAGITATWLSPIFKSPGVDQGYDISDYTEIDEIFGTMTDFENLIAEAKKLGIKIILDFVPNHTSNLHEWFIKSENNEKGYEDYYIWVNGTEDKLPNNWLSQFYGSSWTWSDKRKQYYLHNFAEQQPDLNYNSEAVVQSMLDILKYWLDKGVDGFRMDAVPFLFEDPTFRDAPLARGYTECKNDPICLEYVNVVKDRDDTYNMIYRFRDYVDQYAKENRNETIVLMSEAYTTIENTMLYYESADGIRKGAHFTFNFNFISYLKENVTVTDIANAINKWLVYLPLGATSNWVLGNHDNRRVASRFGEENVDGFNMLIAFLPGVMVTYNGEEIGMLDGEVSCEQGKDPAAIKNCSTFNTTSRDFERTPFQWDNSKYAGFSIVEPWLPVGSSKDYINLDAQSSPSQASHYNVYKDLVKYRNVFKKTSKIDNLAVVKLSDNILEIVRERDNKDYILLFNVGNDEENVSFFKKERSYKVVVSSVGSIHEVGTVLEQLVMKPHESLILESV